MMQTTSLSSWEKLKSQIQAIKLPLSTQGFQCASHDISLDYSYQGINDEILQLLLDLAKECKLKKNIEDLLSGMKVNTTEDRPALHTALRHFDKDPFIALKPEIIHQVLAARERMFALAEQIRNGEWLGYSGKAITDVVNIGIGGSQLGPQFCINALIDFTTNALNFHFISDFDPNDFRRTVAKLNPETTLFIVSSKSFSTMETISNARKAFAWIDQPQHNENHFIAVTQEIEKAKDFGIKTVLPIWDWVGGRYSLCSAINLITCIAIGSHHFLDFLAGAHAMDRHFYENEFEVNLPVLLALIGIWNINFLDINNLLILTYSHDLKYLIPYIQQLDMESNGKSVNKQGQHIHYNTGPLVWGGSGNQAQHSYYQLLCQGTNKVAADLITVDAFNDQAVNWTCVAQKTILTQGVLDEECANGYIRGKTPINHISLHSIKPKTIGSLIALYEHKVFAQSVIWNINPFDQPGVESSKKLVKRTMAVSNSSLCLE